MFKKTIDHIIVGIGISFIITNIMLLIFAQNALGNEIIYSYILWMVAGAIYGLLSMIHHSNLNKMLSVLLHFVSITIVSFISIEIMLRFIFKIAVDISYGWIFLEFFIIYILISFSIYLYEKISVKALNKKLQEVNK